MTTAQKFVQTLDKLSLQSRYRYDDEDDLLFFSSTGFCLCSSTYVVPDPQRNHKQQMRVRLHACMHCMAVRTRRMQGLLMHGLQQPFDPESVTCVATAVAQLGSLLR